VRDVAAALELPQQLVEAFLFRLAIGVQGDLGRERRLIRC
jgi:hypothetical protein